MQLTSRHRFFGTYLIIIFNEIDKFGKPTINREKVVAKKDRNFCKSAGRNSRGYVDFQWVSDKAYMVSDISNIFILTM